MLDKSRLGGSWESVMSRDERDIDRSRRSASGTPRSSPLKDTSNIQSSEEQIFCVSRHDPNKTFRRESVIASWKSVKKERERALGKRFIYVDADGHEDYYGRNRVKRCKSDRTANAPRIQRKVKRTYSVFHRYDPSAERVIKEYKYLKNQPEDFNNHPEEVENVSNRVPVQKSVSEPFLSDILKESKSKRKAKRSITTLLSIKTKFLNIFSSKS